jgi:hypothetical protein
MISRIGNEGEASTMDINLLKQAFQELTNNLKSTNIPDDLLKFDDENADVDALRAKLE